MNKKTIIISLIVIIILSAGVGFWKWEKDKKIKETKKQEIAKQEEIKKEEATEIDMSDWKTYRNEEYGFEIKYPKEWEVCDKYDGITFSIMGTSEEVKKQGNIPYDLENKDNKGDLVFVMWIDKGVKKDYSSLENWKEYAIKNATNNNRDYYISNFSFSNNVLVILNHKYGEKSLYVTSYSFFHNNDGHDTGIFYSEKTNGIAQKILSTLKFDN